MASKRETHKRIKAFIQEHTGSDSFVLVYSKVDEGGQTDTGHVTSGNEHAVVQLAHYIYQRLWTKYADKHDLPIDDNPPGGEE